MVFGQDLFEDGEIVLRLGEHLPHLAGHLLGIQHHIILHRGVERQRDVGVHGLQTPHQFLVGNVGGEADRVRNLLLGGQDTAAEQHNQQQENSFHQKVRPKCIPNAGLCPRA